MHCRDPIGKCDGAGKFSIRFFVGPENQLLDVLWNAVTERDSSYNPVTLCGPSGVGKTHFVGTLARRFRDRHPQLKTLFWTGHDFVRAFASAVEVDSISEFRNKCRSADFFALDGLEPLAQMHSAQVELLYTLDALRRQNRWVFVTAQKIPARMQSLHPGLRSRLVGGLTVPVATLSPSTRNAVIEELVREQCPPADRHHCELQLRYEIKRQEALQTVPELRDAFAQLARRPEFDPDRGDADASTSQALGVKKVNVREITKRVAKYFRLKQADLTGPSRRQGIVHARNVAIFLARQFTETSYEKIGRHFGNRDHTTVLHAFQRIASLLESDAETQQAIRELTEQLSTP